MKRPIKLFLTGFLIFLRGSLHAQDVTFELDYQWWLNKWAIKQSDMFITKTHHYVVVGKDNVPEVGTISEKRQDAIDKFMAGKGADWKHYREKAGFKVVKVNLEFQPVK